MEHPINTGSTTGTQGVLDLEPKANNPEDNRNVGPRNRKVVVNKADWTLIPWDMMEEVVMAFESGKLEYGRDNWKIAGGKGVYWAAGFRHMKSWFCGEIRDKKTGLHHLAHAIACCLIIMHKDING